MEPWLQAWGHPEFGPARACQIPRGRLIPALWNLCSVTSGRQHSHHVLCLWEAAVQRHLAVWGKPHLADGVLGCSSFSRGFPLGLPNPVTPACSPQIQSKAMSPICSCWLPQSQRWGCGTGENHHWPCGLLHPQGAWQQHHQGIGFCQLNHGPRKDLVALRGFYTLENRWYFVPYSSSGAFNPARAREGGWWSAHNHCKK